MILVNLYLPFTLFCHVNARKSSLHFQHFTGEAGLCLHFYFLYCFKSYFFHENKIALIQTCTIV